MAPSADFNLNASPAQPESPERNDGFDSSDDYSTAGEPGSPAAQVFELSADPPAWAQPGMQGGPAAAVHHQRHIPPQRAARRPRRNAVIAPSAPAPPPRPFQDYVPEQFRSPWPREQPDVPGGRPDVSNRCPHDLVYPCFCRNTVDPPGFICQGCRMPLCDLNRSLQMGTSAAIQLEIQREIARDRNAAQFLQELRWCLEAALAREGRYGPPGPGPYSN